MLQSMGSQRVGHDLVTEQQQGRWITENTTKKKKKKETSKAWFWKFIISYVEEVHSFYILRMSCLLKVMGCLSYV